VTIPKNTTIRLDGESGGHRFQRVPPTERSGRVHTSTVTVAVMDKMREAPLEHIPERDLEIQWFSGSGAGGQHRNKHQNSCRLLHIPTGTVKSAQTRDRTTSYREAYEALLCALRERSETASRASLGAERASKVGTGMRGDKIRTYRYQDDTMTDHVTGKRYPLHKVMSGHMPWLTLDNVSSIA